MTKFILFILAIGMVSCSVKEVTRNKLEIPPTIDMSTPVEVKSAPAPASKVYIDNKPKEVCPHCKGTGEILQPAMQVGKMIEYHVQRCICQKKKR